MAVCQALDDDGVKRAGWGNRDIQPRLFAAAPASKPAHDSSGRCRRTDSFRLCCSRCRWLRKQASNERASRRRRRRHRRRWYVLVSFRFCRLATVNRLKAYLTGMYLTPRPRSVAIKSMLSFPFFASHSLSNALYHPVCLAGWLAGCLVILTDRSFCLRLPGFLVLIVLVIHQVSEVSFLKISFLYCLPSIIFRTSSVESTREDIIADR